MSHASDEVLGPIDYAVLEFASDRHGPAAASGTELAALVDTELIRILDLVVLARRADGGIDVIEYEELHGRGGLAVLDGRLAELLSEHDIEEIGSTLRPDASGMAIVFENTWAAPLTTALRDGGERIVASGRIPMGDLSAALGADADGADP